MAGFTGSKRRREKHDGRVGARDISRGDDVGGEQILLDDRESGVAGATVVHAQEISLVAAALNAYLGRQVVEVVDRVAGDEPGSDGRSHPRPSEFPIEL